MSDFIHDKIIVPMNNFAEKHLKFISQASLVISIISIIISIISLVMQLSLI